MVITLNQRGQIAKCEIIRSRKLKRRIRARPFLVFVDVAERMIHEELRVRLDENRPARFVRRARVSFAGIEKEYSSARSTFNRLCASMRRVGAGCAECNCNGDGNERSHKSCENSVKNSKPQFPTPAPRIGSSDDRSWLGTARLFPTVPACSTGWRIHHDRLDR